MTMRPGSKAARSLFCKGTQEEWNSALSKYDETVKAVGKARKKEKELVKWDKWMRQELSPALETRGCLSKEELAIVMNWKITRGTFRPLMNQLLANTEKLAVVSTKLAVSRLQEKGSAEQKIKGAIEALCQLRGIGPATATAILCCHAPKLIPFMSDEALEGAGLERKYTLGCYIELAKLLATKAKELGGEWTAELVGRAMWTEGLSQIHGVSTPSPAKVPEPAVVDAGGEPSSAKRKRGGGGESDDAGSVRTKKKAARG
mmetsp:Transcript_55555/g.130115  ORF Transcript_55555/g.130115 Transcript_55555/m.130115 type:complete len:260 (+) Transcript_55555:302-1081(+)|eukprot:2213399-Rhodomonas_salina.3